MTIRDSFRISPSRPICEMEIQDIRPAYGDEPSFMNMRKCQNYATYGIDGKCFCGIHKRKAERMYKKESIIVTHISYRDKFK